MKIIVKKEIIKIILGIFNKFMKDIKVGWLWDGEGVLDWGTFIFYNSW